MSLKQSPPGKGEGGRAPHFIHIKTTGGERWHAYIAGPCMWFSAHPSGRTKPCVNVLTDGELVCQICNPLKPVEPIGYLPLYRELDGRPGFVVLHECAGEQLASLTLHTRVIVGRGDDQADGVFVTKALSQEPRMRTGLRWKQQDIDLTDSLLRVWGIPELKDWYARTQKPVAAVKQLPPGVAVNAAGVAFSPAMQAAAKRAGCVVSTEAEIADTFAGSLKRIKERAHTNGNGKPT